jgi:xanthine dehydrogenase accessory factor
MSNTQKKLPDLVIGIKGAGEMASGIAWRLYRANLKKIFMMEIPRPLAVRREVSFCEALVRKRMAVEGVHSVRVESVEEIRKAWDNGDIAVIADPDWESISALKPDAVVDAILSKRNLGTSLREAALVIALGPGFEAGQDAHMVIETNRGHNLGRVICSGRAEPNTGIPGNIGGFAEERVFRSPCAGVFISQRNIGDIVRRGDVLGAVDREDILVEINGVIRGLIMSGIQVKKGMKLGDIDPRGDATYCSTISDKARAIGGAVLESILCVHNR